MEQIDITGEDTVYRLTEENGSERVLKFDNIYTKWILGLYELGKHIAVERDKRGIVIAGNVTVPIRYQFYGLAEMAVDQFMYFLVKDTLSETEGNKELGNLCYHLINQCNGNVSEYATLKNYFINLVMYSHNPIVQAQFYDFYIDFWTGFEACINLISNEYEGAIKQKLDDSQFKDMRNYLRKLYEKGDGIDTGEALRIFEDDKDKYLKKFGKYVDFPSRYNYLKKEVIKEHYKRDWNQDNEILQFCGALRNTMHNNGTHLKADRKITINGVDFELKKMQKMYQDSFGDIFILAGELFDIYVAMVDGLDEV